MSLAAEPGGRAEPPAMAGPPLVPYELAGISDAVRACVVQVERAAADDRHIVISAERGLDAEAVARVLHGRSPRRAAPFVPVSSGAGAAEVERALFGGTHRSAGGEIEIVSPAGAVYRANGGILFLASITELPATVQRRLARVLRDGEVRLSRRAGTVTLDVRVIGSSETSVDGELREDLARRLTVHIHVPALRERRDDIPAIAGAMLEASRGGHRFTAAALTVLAALPWRRNIAELSALIGRLDANGTGRVIRQEDVLAEVQLDRSPVRAAGSLRDARRQFERDYIAAVLRDHEWQMRDAARALGIERANLYRKARQLGIPLKRDAASGASRSPR
jgi:DNA-binding NtrC family response regulator